MNEASQWKAKCPKCCEEYPRPPRDWNCPRCSVKCWQPDDDTTVCMVCKNSVAKFSRHHCRQCGYVTCGDCTKYTTIIPEWSASDRQKVCKSCAVPNEAPAMSGFLQKLGAKSIFGEKFQKRYFELRGVSLAYANDRGSTAHGVINLENAKVMDVATHPNAFCLIGPKLQRGYVLSADTAEQKKTWMDKINIALGGQSANGNDEDDMHTESVLFTSNSHQGVCMADFEVNTVLGLGSFGRVMKVTEKRTGNIYAMKVLDKAQIVANKMVNHTQAEKDILGSIDHPFIVKLHYAFQTRKHLVLVLDFLCGGELFFHLQRCKRFSESRARFYAAEIGLALESIHSRNIIYRDLKPENLVLDRYGHVTLTDFGLAKREVHDMTHTFCGTPEYMAPELIQKSGHTCAVDWWSLGVFLYEMVAGLPPFYHENVATMYEMILHRPLVFPRFFSADLQDLLRRLLDRDPKTRLQQGSDFCRHPFFRDIDWERLKRKELRPEFVPDVANNDLKYFDKQFTQETVQMPNLDLPNDPNDPTSKRFEGFDYSTTGGGDPSSQKSPQPAAAATPQGGKGKVVIDQDLL